MTIDFLQTLILPRLVRCAGCARIFVSCRVQCQVTGAQWQVALLCRLLVHGEALLHVAYLSILASALFCDTSLQGNAKPKFAVPAAHQVCRDNSLFGLCVLCRLYYCTLQRMCRLPAALCAHKTYAWEGRRSKSACLRGNAKTCDSTS